MSDLIMKGENSNAQNPSAAVMALSARDICEQFMGSCHPSTFWRLRKKDATFPASFSLGGHPLWHRADVQAWYDAKRTTQAEAA